MSAQEIIGELAKLDRDELAQVDQKPHELLEKNFWRPMPSALLALGLRSDTDIPALKELKESFDSRKKIRGIAKLDPFFERTSKLASRRLKREIEPRGTLGEFVLEPDPPHLERIPPEESGADLLRSNGSDSRDCSKSLTTSLIALVCALTRFRRNSSPLGA